MSKPPEQMGEMSEEESVEREGLMPETEKIVNHDGKTIELTPEIKVTCSSRVVEEASGHESGTDYLYLVTKRGRKLVDSSSNFIDLKGARMEGNEVVITYTKIEKHYKNREVWSEPVNNPNLAKKIDTYTEAVEEPREYEKRISLHQ